MGRSCSVPGCKSNYSGTEGDGCVATFGFPTTDTQLREKWIKAIHRENFTVSKHSCVCILHFDERFILRSEIFKGPNGTVAEIPRVRPKLTKDAYPTIFPNQPSYHTVEVPQARQDPNHRALLVEKRDEAQFREWMGRDKIRSFEELKNGLKERKCEPFTVIFKEDYILFVRIEDSYFAEPPSISIGFKIAENLDVFIFKNQTKIPTSKYKWILGEDLKCNLWTRLDNLISSLKGPSETIILTVKEHIDLFAEIMNDRVEYDVELKEEAVCKIKFLSEQLQLAVTPSIRYSSDMMVWAASVHYAFPGAYRLIRDSDTLTLPHPKYLQKILCRMGRNESGIGPAQVAFLKEKFKLLDDCDKVVTIMLDEIYVQSKISYKSGKLFGMSGMISSSTSTTSTGSTSAASNDSSSSVAVTAVQPSTSSSPIAAANTSSDCTAKTIQAFMASSLQSDNKDVVALFPVSNLDSSDLYKLTLSVLKLMAEVGFTVLCLISDNNSVNKKMFDLLSGGTIKSRIENPFDPSTPLFLLYDQVHLFKNIRNNWLNAASQTLKIPICPQFDPLEFSMLPQQQSDTGSQILEVEYSDAKFSEVRNLFDAERNSTLKLAPKLCRKAVYPSSIERQNVSLVVSVFHDTTINALQTLMKEKRADVSSATIYFLLLIVRWWKISNVKNKYKGRRINDMWSEPLMGLEDVKLKFLKDFSTYLDIWALSGETGRLTPQTHAALQHTINTTIELCIYVFEVRGWRFILLGKLQTDNLEGRFGGYRRLSGCTYHVHVEQVLESERKLKLLSVLKLKSAKKGDFSITSFVEGCHEAAKVEQPKEDLEFFYDAISERENITVTLSDYQVLIVLTSYASTKVIQERTRNKKPVCSDCKKFLITNEILDIERADDIYNYMSGLDRGGLYKPAEFSFDLCVNIFKLFQTLISINFEERFLTLAYHREAIVELGTRMCEKILDDIESVCGKCGLSLRKIIKKFLRVMSNILLNNYTKTLNEMNTARQLAIKLEKQAEKRKQEVNGKEKDCTERKIKKLSST